MAFKFFLLISLLISFASPGIPADQVFKSHSEYQEVVRKLFPHLKTERLEAFVRKFSSFHDRHGKTVDNEAERWLLQEIRSVIGEYKAGHTSTRQIDVSSFNYKQENHIVNLEGHDPNLKNELIILGAHYDTWISGNGKDVPGADDNATGCSVLFEVLHLLSQFGIKLKRSLEFHFYTGNEGVQLFGSQKVMERYKEEDKIRNIKGMLSLDRLGYQKEPLENKGIGVVDNYDDYKWDEYDRMTSPALTSFVKMLVKEYANVETEEMSCNARCVSDNFNWHKAGAPAAHLTEFTKNLDYDKYWDIPPWVNFKQVQEFAKLAVAFVIELGELAEIPNLPDLPTNEPMPKRKRSFAGKPEVGRCFIGIIVLISIGFLR